MLKRKRILSSLLIVTIVLFFGCERDSVETDGSELFSASYAPYGFVDIDDLLSEIATMKFIESPLREEILNHSPEKHEILMGIEELFEPYIVRPDLRFLGIEIWRPGVHFRPNFNLASEIRYSNAPISLSYSNSGSHPTIFQWNRTKADDEYFLLNKTPNPFFEARAEWSQYGYDFYAQFSKEMRTDYGNIDPRIEESQSENGAFFTDEDIQDFCNAKLVCTWELLGNAVSMTVQGMENVRIFDEIGNEIINGDETKNYRHFVGITLFRNASGIIEKVGYRWQIDEELLRYQYVLEPGVYTFLVYSNPNRTAIDWRGEYVCHFVAGELVSSIDYSRRNTSATEFTITVTSDPADTVITKNN